MPNQANQQPNPQPQPANNHAAQQQHYDFHVTQFRHHMLMTALHGMFHPNHICPDQAMHAINAELNARAAQDVANNFGGVVQAPQFMGQYNAFRAQYQVNLVPANDADAAAADADLAHEHDHNPPTP